jgi:hypothetical protein
MVEFADKGAVALLARQLERRLEEVHVEPGIVVELRETGGSGASPLQQDSCRTEGARDYASLPNAKLE